MKQIHYLLIALCIGLCALGVVFSRNGILNVQIDTQVYVDQIRYYNGAMGMTAQTELRSFKPFYGIVGSLLTPLVTEHQAILIINLLFYFGIIIFSFFFLREIGFTEKFAVIGSAWIATGYPVLKYGLALLTDISGWFFALATITVFLIGLRKNSSWLLVLSSCITFVGSLCKETGVLGLFFAGVYLLSMFLYTKENKYIKNIVKITLPFVILQSIFLYTLFNGSNSGISFLEWFLYNKEVVPSLYYTFYYFFFTEASTFSLLWVYALYLIYILFKRKITAPKEKYILGISLLVATLPVLVWPMFLTRVLYIGYLAIVPCALASLYLWSSYNKEKRAMFYILSIAPVITSISLFLLASGGSLFDVLKRLV